MKLIIATLNPRWCTKYKSPTAAIINDSYALVENPCTTLATKRYLKLTFDSPIAVPMMSKRLEMRKTCRLPYLRLKAQTKGPEQPAARRL